MAGFAGTATNARQSDSGILPSRWVVDTGATSHGCNDIRLMSDVHWYSHAQHLNVATGEQSGSKKACGNVHVVDVEGNLSIHTNVEYVPKALENLLSVLAAVDSGFNFTTNEVGEIVRLTHMKTLFQSVVFKAQGLYYVTPACITT